MQCKALKTNGQPCEAYSQKASDYCYLHDPAKASERAAARKLGGYRRRATKAGDLDGLPDKIRTLEDVLMVLDYALRDALALENSIARGRLLVALAAEFTKVISETELEARIAALEAIYEARKQRR